MSSPGDQAAPRLDGPAIEDPVPSSAPSMREPSLDDSIHDPEALGLPPLPTDQPISVGPATSLHTLPPGTDTRIRRVRKIEAASSKGLVVFVGALMGFAGGITLGVLVLTGILDIDAPWIKPLFDLIRGR